MEISKSVAFTSLPMPQSCERGRITIKPVLRFLVTGDLQVHAWKQFSTTLPDGTNSRLENTLKVFDILKREAKARGIDKVLLNGDILEESDDIKTEVYSGLYKRIESLHLAGIDTALNLGNHDVVQQTEFSLIHSLLPFRSIARVIERPIRLWKYVWVVPWMGNSSIFKRSVASIKIARERPRILVTHIGITGSQVGPRNLAIKTAINTEDLCPSKFDLILLSDFHTRQKIAPHTFYMGSPIQHTFGETHEPCIWQISLYDKHPWYRREAISTALPRFRNAVCTSKSDLLHILNSYPGDFVRLSIPVSCTRLSDFYIEDKAKEAGCQIQITREVGVKERTKIPKIVKIENVIKKYAKTKKLARLGIKLFQ